MVCLTNTLTEAHPSLNPEHSADEGGTGLHQHLRYVSAMMRFCCVCVQSLEAAIIFHQLPHIPALLGNQGAQVLIAQAAIQQST